ncbi:luciferase family protein [Streptomyces sp. NPDC086554]|uniref:luciferase domain-containing protein n=1 Tax=Streptomyces sp. NPDC086554 TaxID=3154864 RepID=UPI00344A3FD1
MAIQHHLSSRSGPKPRTGPAIPHQQLSQIAPAELQEQLWSRMLTLAGATAGRSNISFPETRALHLAPEAAAGPAEAFLIGTEFAHLHGVEDGSLHLALPESEAQEVVAAGWGELHPLAREGRRPPTLLMVFGPRDEHELEIVWELVRRSHRFATS